MEFLIYDITGRLVCSFFAFRIEDVAWNQHADKFVTGRYFVVGQTGGRIISTHFVTMDVTNNKEGVIYKSFKNDIDIDNREIFHISVDGMFDTREDRINMEIPVDVNGEIPELPKIVKFFTDRGNSVFCRASGWEMEYVYPLVKVDVEVTTLGSKT